MEPLLLPSQPESPEAPDAVDMLDTDYASEAVVHIGFGCIAALAALDVLCLAFVSHCEVSLGLFLTVIQLLTHVIHEIGHMLHLCAAIDWVTLDSRDRLSDHFDL